MEKKPANQTSQDKKEDAPGSSSSSAGVTAAGVTAEEPPAKLQKLWDGVLPNSDAAEDAMLTMVHLIPKVHSQLPVALASWAGSCNKHVVKESLFQVEPLKIKGTMEDGELTSFKAPWETDKCQQAVATTGLYEAAVNITWLDARQRTKIPFDFPMTKPAWSTVYDIYVRQFSKEGSGLGGVTPNSASRLYFPVPIPGFVLDAKLLEATCFNESLVLSGGHALVYAWYVGMYVALQTEDEEWIKRLWECGLTVTFRVRKANADDLRNLLLDSLNYSEACQVAKVANTDSFSTFTQKLQAFTKVFKKENPKATQDTLIKNLVKQGVRYKGSPMNATMYKMSKSVFEACDDNVRDQMEKLEWKYGPEVLSSSYNKVGRLVQHCQKVVSAGQGIELDEALSFLLQMMDYVVSSEKVRSAKFFTMDVVDKQRDGSQGWFGMVLNKLKYIRYFEKMFLEPLKKENEALWKTLKTDVMPLFSDPEKVSLLDIEASVGVTTRKLTPVAQQVYDLLLMVYNGELDPCFKSTALEQHMRETFASCTDENHAFKEARDALVAVQRGAATMAVVPGGVTPGSPEGDDTKKRTLARNESCVSVEGEADTRSDLQKKCTQERKKYVQFVTIPKITKKHMDDAYASSGVRQVSTGKDSHRGFFFSADMHVEHATDPWLNHRCVGDDILKAVTESYKEMKGSHDWLFFFDGRNKDVESSLSNYMAGRQHKQELMLLYSAAKSEGARTRRVALSASNVERLLLFPPCAKTALVAKPRDTFNALGESSTHDTTYSGITKRSRKAMPRITEEDKRLIVGGSASGVPDQLLQAFPNPVLYWQEAKPVDLLEQLLTDFDMRAVFDISPGSGALAEAALRLGISYVGVTTTSTHAKWLGNVIDRVAMGHLAMPGRPLYNKEVASDVNTYFGDMLAGLQESADMEDVDVDSLMPECV